MSDQMRKMSPLSQGMEAALRLWVFRLGQLGSVKHILAIGANGVFQRIRSVVIITSARGSAVPSLNSRTQLSLYAPLKMVQGDAMGGTIALTNRRIDFVSPHTRLQTSKHPW